MLMACVQYRMGILPDLDMISFYWVYLVVQNPMKILLDTKTKHENCVLDTLTSSFYYEKCRLLTTLRRHKGYQSHVVEFLTKQNI